MGNSRWRLASALEYLSDRVAELRRQEDVEIIIADWGSEVPIRDVLELTRDAAKLVSFVYIPPSIAHSLQKDSPFPEVLALNAAIRRAQGRYIGRIDQDTLVGSRFLREFFRMHEKPAPSDPPLDKSILFSQRRDIPYRFAIRNPSSWQLYHFVKCFGSVLPVEGLRSGSPFYSSSVGIIMFHRDMWLRCSAYDERMIYMNAMETSLVRRLQHEYELVNLGILVGYDFYHLEHFHPSVPRKSSHYRKVNPSWLSETPQPVHPNSANWGLSEYALEILPCRGLNRASFDGARPRGEIVGFTTMLAALSVPLAIDAVQGYLRVWQHRAKTVRQLVNGQPFSKWPRVLIGFYREKRISRQLKRKQ